MIDLEHGLDVLRVIGRHTRANPVDAVTICELTGVVPRTVAEVVSIAVARGVRVEVEKIRIDRRNGEIQLAGGY
jgi:hypothetical protein